jgi:hypothetical protein
VTPAEHYVAAGELLDMATELPFTMDGQQVAALIAQALVHATLATADPAVARAAATITGKPVRPLAARPASPVDLDSERYQLEQHHWQGFVSGEGLRKDCELCHHPYGDVVHLRPAVSGDGPHAWSPVLAGDNTPLTRECVECGQPANTPQHAIWAANQ